HRIADRVEYNTSAVLALATGHADRFYNETRLTEARMARVGEENSSPCRLSLAMAQVEKAIPLSDATFAQFDRMSDHEQAQMARLAARRARMQAQLTRIEIPAIQVPEIHIPEIQVPEIHVPAVRVPAVHVQPVVVNVPDVHVCPRVRVNIP